MSDFLGDIRLGLRQLKTQPGHSSVVIVTLGLALGLSAVIFSFVSFFLLRPLPIRDEKTMILARSSHPQQSGNRPRLSYRDFVDFRAETKTVEELVGMSMSTGALTGQGDARRVSVAGASEGLFRVWDLGVVAGRRFLASEDQPGAPAVLLLAHGFWEREFGSDRSIVGKTLTLDGRAGTVVGIVSPEIEIGRFSEIDLWIPLAQSSPSEDRQRRDLTVTGRRKPGVTTEQVGAEFATIAARLQKEHPETNRDWTAGAIPLRDGLYGSGTEVILALLVVGVCLVFAVACANVAGVMLARATTREREMALRTSLGAERGQITRQLVVEGAVLSLLGAALGLVLAQLGIELMRAMAFEQFYDLVTIDARVLAFSAALALAAPLIFSLVPALQLAGRQLSGVLRDSGASAGTSGRVGRSRRGLVVLQIGLATALVIVSGLSVRTALALRDFDYGYDIRDVLTARIDLGPARYKTPDDILRRLTELGDALRSRPEVKAVAIGTDLPAMDRGRSMALRREGSAEETSAIAAVSSASPGYFRALGIAVRQGREFLDSDVSESTAVGVVNQALASRDFKDRDPLGQRIQLGGTDAPWVEIVGVVSDVANPSIVEPPVPQVYRPFAQRPERSLVVMVRTSDPAPVLASLRQTMRTLDADQPLYDAKTVEQVAFEELASNRIITGLFMALGLVALALSAVGLYGLAAFLVSQRTREIGVRMALGATVGDILRLVVVQGARLTIAGLAAGLALGIALGRAMSSVLFDVKPWDVLTLVVTLATLGSAAVIAHWAPARRAATVNPTDALRHD
jgi:putative ABC transport system permease protein